jgi:hypothetical protein
MIATVESLKQAIERERQEAMRALALERLDREVGSPTTFRPQPKEKRHNAHSF